MAISAPHYYCLRELHRRGELPQGGTLLEIGEAQWYGDIAPPWRDKLPQQLTFEEYIPLSFELVKELYADLFGNPKVTSIDLDGPTSQKIDLNEIVMVRNAGDTGTCETVINHGTAEHIFNVANVYRAMHDACKVGGLMIHEGPFTGWIDHGFWCIQPTLYYDLAAANGYDLRYMAVTQIEHQMATEIHSREQLLKMAQAGGVPNNAMLYVAMRKTTDKAFKIPMQGFYAQTISAEASEAWRELR